MWVDVVVECVEVLVDEEDEDENSHQLSSYKGEKKVIVKRAIIYMRFFLLNVNAYPEKDDLVKWAYKAFKTSCQVSYGPNYEGEQQS